MAPHRPAGVRLAPWASYAPSLGGWLTLRAVLLAGRGLCLLAQGLRYLLPLNWPAAQAGQLLTADAPAGQLSELPPRCS